MKHSQAAVIEAVACIEGRLDSNLTLTELSKEVCLSPYHLHRSFTDTVGLTPHAYLRRRQLTEAARALVTGDQAIADVALSAGYQSQQAFTGVFKALYKRTPGAYRTEGTFYPLLLPFSPAPAGGCAVSAAAAEDLPGWMSFVRQVVGGFPRFDEAAHRAAVRQAILRRQAAVLRAGETVLGGGALSPEDGRIGFLAVHPQCPVSGAEDLLRCLLRLLPMGPVEISTFRPGDPADNGQRQTYLRLGFTPGPSDWEFGYPVQRLILTAERREALYGSPL